MSTAVKTNSVIIKVSITHFRYEISPVLFFEAGFLPLWAGEIFFTVNSYFRGEILPVLSRRQGSYHLEPARSFKVNSYFHGEISPVLSRRQGSYHLEPARSFKVISYFAYYFKYPLWFTAITP